MTITQVQLHETWIDVTKEQDSRDRRVNDTRCNILHLNQLVVPAFIKFKFSRYQNFPDTDISPRQSTYSLVDATGTDINLHESTLGPSKWVCPLYHHILFAVALQVCILACQCQFLPTRQSLCFLITQLKEVAALVDQSEFHGSS